MSKPYLVVPKIETLDLSVSARHILPMNKQVPIFSQSPIQWSSAPAPVQYPDAVAAMEMRIADITDGNDKELIWIVEHPPLYTAGTSADARDLIDPDRFPVFKSGRGGQYTYHGPGQLVGYFMLDLRKRGRDVRAFVAALEQLVIDTLADFGVAADRRSGRIGVWVVMPDKSEAKIAAVGVRIRKWISYHGISININPDLSHYAGIVPCGISEHGVTSLAALGIDATTADVEAALKRNFERIFGPVSTVV